ncbi:hepatitis A virus cellular receptor 1 [Biomphalaria pfeifferi]|uniref:Hepatitis A virus cellular receptor 1 n=1 Tax=Biomphalaria pfeifferi TaxID=112525 RepID=A0AAD8BG76_BIOPF|nr:hepatitis A virus cellular receptor 1 [Biomphalaria pfeifferi]
MSLTFVTSNTTQVCQEVKPCYCQFSSSQYLDLTTLPQSLTVKYQFSTYVIQLCKKFTKKQCTGVLGCKEPLVGQYGSIGTTRNFVSESLVELVGGDKGRLSKIVLECSADNKTEFSFVNQTNETTFTFKLISNEVCIKTLPTAITTVATTSTTQHTNASTPTTILTNATSATTHSTNATTATTHPTNATTATTHPTNATTATTHPTNATTATTHPTNATTATTHPTNATTATTHPTNATTATTHITSPKTTQPTTTHKGGANIVSSNTAVTLLILCFVTNKLSH